MFDFLSQKFSSLFNALTQKSHITEKDIDATITQLKDTLLEADVPLDIAESFINDLKNESIGKKIQSQLKPGEQFVALVHTKMVAFLGGQVATQTAPFAFQIPSVAMVMGLQGSGKTTTIGKLAYYVQQQAESRGKKRSILLASVDYYRPAAIDQLETLAQQTGVSFYRASSSDPIAAVKEILAHYRNNQFELLLLDTAGRLHIDSVMLEELRSIDALVSPKYKLLVLDAMTGQESLRVAQAFEQGVGFNAGILTKMDSNTRAGAAFGFRYALKKPIIFVGVGEKVADLEVFRPERIAQRMLGMGDIQTLLEQAQQKIKKDEQDAVSRSFNHGKMTLADFAQYIEMMNKLGSLTSLTKFLPGAASLKLSPEALEKGERELKRFKAIISSMTPKERFYPKILNPSRKQRIAQGAGVGVADINNLLTRFEESQQFAKLFKKLGRGPNIFK